LRKKDKKARQNPSPHFFIPSPSAKENPFIHIKDAGKTKAKPRNLFPAAMEDFARACGINRGNCL
jgi:hypothetical protein